MRRMKNLHIMCEDSFRQTSCNLSASAIKKPSEEKLKFFCIGHQFKNLWSFSKKSDIHGQDKPHNTLNKKIIRNTAMSRHILVPRADKEN